MLKKSIFSALMIIIIASMAVSPAYAGVSGDFSPLHMDETYAKTTHFGQRVAHGLMGLTLADGLKVQSAFFQDGIALGWAWRFKGPILIGDTLQLHPMIRVTARFKEPFNELDWGVPTEQVDQFKPALTLGCSYSSIPHLALWMGAQLGNKQDRLRDWRRTAIFYVAAVGTGKGKIRDLPLVNEPFIRLPLTRDDLARIGEGLSRLGELLFAAGAEEVSSPIEGSKTSFRSAADVEQVARALPQGSMAVSTIHLFSSAPMGSDEARCATDSFGKVLGTENLYVNDASLFPSSPAVNPQGTVLAVARRNICEFLA